MIIGHTLVYQSLEGAIEKQHHHGFLLAGPKGIGKAKLAKAIAIAALAKASQQPFQIIEKQCLSGAYPNYIYITKLVDDDGKTKNDITVEQIRNLLNRLKLKSAFDAPRFVIIDSIDNLNRQAANALLKMLEEPPLNTFFLNICHQASGVLPTIRSRCLLLNFKSLSDDDLKKVVTQSDTSKEFSAEISYVAKGSVGQYLLIQNAGGEKVLNSVEKLLKITNLSDLKAAAQEVLKNTDDTFVLEILHQLLYQKAMAQPGVYANSAQAVERFLRFTQATYIDASQRICAAVLLAQNPNQQQLIYG
jgi:DNA polymerase-3 subunit delta'